MSKRDATPDKPAYYGPSQTALLFLDYHNILIQMIPNETVKQTLIDSANTLLTNARKSEVAIIHCLIDTGIDPPPTSKIYEQWLTINKPALKADPDLAKEYYDFAPLANSIGPGGGFEMTSLRLPGPRSAFTNKDLLPLLRNELGVTSLILAGIATSGAIIGTALQAIDEAFVVTVVEEATWDPNEQVHRDILDIILPVSAHVMSTEEAVGHLSKH